MDKQTKPRKWGVLLLFISIPTLLCCALPILFVSLGVGSVVALLYGEYFPFLQWFGRNTHITFGVTALILLVAGWALYRPDRTCPIDPWLSDVCNAAHKWNLRFFWSSVAIWCISAFTAFLLPLLL